MSKNKDIENHQIIAQQTEQETRDAQKFLLEQDVTSDMGKGIIALLAVFLGFMRDPSGRSLSDDPSIKGLFKSVGLSKEDITHADKTGQRLKSGEITAVRATQSVFDRIKEPETTFSSAEARAAVQHIVPNMPKLGNFTIDQRQEAIITTIPLAAEAVGVSPGLMKGMWGVESGFGTSLVSNTGCEGDWQFSQGTWDTIMKRYGDEIAEQIKEDFPDRAEDIAANHSKAGSLNEYQYDPIVSTYAAAFLIKDDAGVMGVDPTKRQNWGTAYAAYNVGSPNARTLVRMEANGDDRVAKNVIGKTAHQNPMFYKDNATAHTALNRYGSNVETRLVQYQQKFGQLEANLMAKAKAGSTEAQIAKNEADPVPSRKPDLEETTLAFNTGGVLSNDTVQPKLLTPSFNEAQITHSGNESKPEYDTDNVAAADLQKQLDPAQSMFS